MKADTQEGTDLRFKKYLLAWITLVMTISAPAVVFAQSGTVLDHQKISDTVGDFTGVLDDDDRFGWSVSSVGDIDGDGVADLVVGVPLDDDGGSARGAVWVLFLNSDGTVDSHQKISDTEGGFTGALDDNDQFGSSVTSPGDLDSDGIEDLVVGARGDGGSNRGAVWVLFLNSDGTVDSHQKISDTEGNFTGTLENGDSFADSVTSPGDLDGDGVVDLVVGAPGDDDGGSFSNRGAVWVLFLNSNGTVDFHQKISDTEGGFTGVLDDNDQFGSSVTSPGDLDSDGVEDLVVGAPNDDDGAFAPRGAVWVLFLNSDGTVDSHQKISNTEGNFAGPLNDGDDFGRSVTSPGDLDGDGVADLIVGAMLDDDGGSNRGAVWVLFLNSDGTVDSHQKISDTAGNFTGPLDDQDRFGSSVTSVGDLDDNGVADLVVGALTDGDGGFARGAVWVLFMNGPLIEAAIDIKFCSNPNGFNCKKKGVLPVTIFGADELDVSEIDISTIELCLASDPDECVSLIDAEFPQDRGNPDTDIGINSCLSANPDGFDDLGVLFVAREVATLIECSSIGKGNSSPTLIIKGELTDGTPFQSTAVDDIGIDQLLIQTK